MIAGCLSRRIGKVKKCSRVLLLTGNIRWYKMDSEVIIK